jgi:hypothetical protein
LFRHPLSSILSPLLRRGERKGRQRVLPWPLRNSGRDVTASASPVRLLCRVRNEQAYLLSRSGEVVFHLCFLRS